MKKYTLAFFLLGISLMTLAQGDAVSVLVDPANEFKDKVLDGYGATSNEFRFWNTQATVSYNIKSNPGFKSIEVEGTVVYDQRPYFVLNTRSGGIKWTNVGQAELHNGSYIASGYYRDYKIRPFSFFGYADASCQAQYHMYPDRIFENDYVSYKGGNFGDITQAYIEYPIDFASYQLYNGKGLTLTSAKEITEGALIIKRPNGSLLAFTFAANTHNDKVQLEVSGNTLKVRHFANLSSVFQRDHGDFVKILYWGRRVFAASSHAASRADILAQMSQELNPISSANFVVEKVSAQSDYYSQNVTGISYDNLKGMYHFSTDGLPWGTALREGKQFYPSAKINIQPQDNRTIYIQHHTYTPDGAGVLTDNQGYPLPVSLGVTRSLGGGAIPDWTASYTNLDPFSLETQKNPAGNAWSTSEFPARLTKGQNVSFNSFHVVHNWGLRQFAGTSSVLSEVPISTSNMGVWCSVDLKPWTKNCGDIRSFSSKVTQWTWNHPCCEGVPGNEVQFAHAMEFWFPQVGFNPLVLKDYKVPRQNFSHFELSNKYSTLSDKLEINYSVGSIADNKQNRLLMTTEFVVKQDISLSGNDRLTLLRMESNPMIFYNVYWKSNLDGSMSPGHVNLPADVNTPSSTIHTIPLEGTNPAFALEDKRWSFDSDNPNFNGDGVEANTYMQVFQKDITINGQKNNNIPFALKLWKYQPEGNYNYPDGSVKPNGHYIIYDLVLEKANLQLKAGDVIKFSYMFMPYGGKYSKDAINSALQTKKDYAFPTVTKVVSGTLSTTSNPWIPTVKSNNGSSAEFSVKGGDNVVTVAIEGLQSYKNPTVYKKVNGNYTPINYSTSGRKDGGTIYIDELGLIGFSLPVNTTPGEILELKIEQDNTDGYGQIKGCTLAQSAYKPNAIPGTIEFEDFDNGCPGDAYHDTSPVNEGGQYRASSGVDIEVCNEGGFSLGWVQTGEWMKYTVNVTTSGTYTLALRIASGSASNKYHVEVDGADRTGIQSVPNYGNFAWNTITIPLTLSAGSHVIRFVVDEAAGAFNLNKMTFSLKRNFWHFAGSAEGWGNPLNASVAQSTSKLDITITAGDPQI
jgi:hypothetical protein